jgi:uncharacterized RDD family membrane protein YckC
MVGCGPRLSLGVRHPGGNMTSVENHSTRYRTFWPRVGAAFLDSAALAPLQWADKLIWNSTSAVLVLLGWSITNVVVFLAYDIVFIAKLGQTPGKMACGVKIVALDDSQPTFKQAILRHILGIFTSLCFVFIQFSNILNGQLENRAFGNYRLFLWFGGIILFWVFLEFATMLTNKRRRAIHDFIAGTVVVRDVGRKASWLLWLLMILFILNFVIPSLISENNIVLGTK